MIGAYSFIDFLLLFADNETLYLKNGYRSVTNKCKWLKIDHESQITRGIGYEEIEGLMIKEVGKYDRWGVQHHEKVRNEQE